MKRSLFALLALSWIGCGDAVVDGACADGYEYCDRACRPVAVCHPAAVAPTTDPCGNACVGEKPICKVQIDGTFACAPPCEAPSAYCGTSCVDPMIDPYNCGGCGIVCPTGLCNGGVCRGASPGHVVVAGHDLVGASPGLAISRVLANAVFLSNRNPVRVLAYEQWAAPASVASVQSILDQTTYVSGRTYTKTVAANAVELRIDRFDVALIFDQPNAPSGALGSIGADTKGALDSFARVGGVVIALDGGTGAGEMPTFLTASGMLAVSAHKLTPAVPVDVVAPADAIGIGVYSPYAAAHSSVTFTLEGTPSPSLITVVAEPTSEKPVVLQKVVFK